MRVVWLSLSIAALVSLAPRLLAASDASPGHAIDPVASTLPINALLSPASRDNRTSIVLAILVEARRGDVATLRQAPIDRLLEATGWPTPHDDLQLSHWSYQLQALLPQLSADHRQAVVEALEQRTLELAELGPLSPSDACVLLPAPSAVAVVRRAANRAFDRADFRTYRQLAARLDATAPDWEPPAARARRAVAAAATGIELDPSALPHARQLADDLPAPVPSAGAGVVWQVGNGHLAACDRWGRVQWQVAVPARAEIMTGPGAAAVIDYQRLVLIDEAGNQFLHPKPRAVRALGVSGGQVWFTAEHTVYGIAPGQGAVTSIVLPTAPLGPPIVAGSSSLWLTAHDVVRVNGETITDRWRHGLAANPDWRLVHDGFGVRVGAGHQWWSLQPGPASPSPRQQLAMAVASYDVNAALAAWDAITEPTEADTRLALAAHLLAGATLDHATALSLCQTPADRALIAMIASDGLRQPALTTAALAAGNADQRLVIPVASPELALAAPVWWHHTITGAGLRQWAARDYSDAAHAATAAPAIIGLERPRDEASARGPGKAERLDDPSTSLMTVAGDWRIGLSVTADNLELSVWLQATNELLWQRRIEHLNATPSQHLRLVDRRLVLTQGGSRVLVFDPDTGVSLLQADLPAGGTLAGVGAVDGLGRIALLEPPGVGLTISLVDPVAATPARRQQQRQASPARWIVGTADGLISAHRDGSLRRWPGGAVLASDNELASGPRPRATLRGLERDGRLWPWRSAAHTDGNHDQAGPPPPLPEAE